MEKRPEPELGGGHDRSARERDFLRELHELTGRPQVGGPPDRADEAGDVIRGRDRRAGDAGGADERGK